MKSTGAAARASLYLASKAACTQPASLHFHSAEHLGSCGLRDATTSGRHPAAEHRPLPTSPRKARALLPSALGAGTSPHPSPAAARDRHDGPAGGGGRRHWGRGTARSQRPLSPKTGGDRPTLPPAGCRGHDRATRPPPPRPAPPLLA